jgi:hypothetical protein
MWLLPVTSGGDCGFLHAVALEHLAHAAESLAGAFFVFDEGEADVGVAELAETDAGGDGYLGFAQEAGGEV